jgi:(2Fe-2S) ferredoxin
MVLYPGGVWYSCKTKEDVDEVIREHLQGGKVVERLKLPG